MTVKPTTLPRWADVGGAITVPPSGKQDIGWATGENPPSQYCNWQQNLNYQWAAFTNQLATLGGVAQCDLNIATGGGATGTLTAAGLITASAGVTAAAGQHFTVSGTGDIKHGDRVLAVSPYIAAPSTSWTVTGSGYMLSSASGSLIVPLTFRQGDRLKLLVFARFGDGAADFTSVSVNVLAAGGGISTIGSTGAITDPAAAWTDTTLDFTDTTLASGDVAYLVFTGNAANLRVGSIRVTYDHP